MDRILVITYNSEEIKGIGFGITLSYTLNGHDALYQFIKTQNYTRMRITVLNKYSRFMARKLN